MVTIENAKRQSVGSVVKNLDVIVTTAGAAKQVDESLPKKQSDQKWNQKLGLTDVSGHIWARLTTESYKPINKGWGLIIKEAIIDEFTTKGGVNTKLLILNKYEIPSAGSEPPVGEGYGEKPKMDGILGPLVEKILEKYDIAATDALWPCTRTNTKTGITTTNWIIYHRYCEQIAAKAGIVFSQPEVVTNDIDDKGKRTVALLVTGQLGHVKEWSFGEASPATTFLPYVFAMAEKRAKDRVILKLAGFHGMVYSDVEEEWKNEK